MLDEWLLRLGMVRDEVEMLLKMYENGNKLGFLAEDFGLTEDEMYDYVGFGYMRVVNLKKTKDKIELVYKINDFYEVLDKIYGEREKRLKADRELIKLIKKNLNRTLVNRCRPANKRIGRPPRTIAKKKRDAKARKLRKIEQEEYAQSEEGKREALLAARKYLEENKD
ncbi:MAG: hypothetical protein WC877_00390 [Dehalococcoidales bacterium]|jgi:hypothetical protein